MANINLLDQQSIQLIEGIDLLFIRIPAGPFLMGSNPDANHYPIENEFPEHSVVLKEYWISKYPVTNSHYKIFIDDTHLRPPDHWENGVIPTGLENHPVVWINWFDAATFCDWLSQRISNAICLPSEAEWEKAARGTDSGETYLYSINSPVEIFFNYDYQFLNHGTSPIGKFSPKSDSPFGCSDMLGNVWEWTADWYDQIYYINSPPSDPVGPESGDCRIIRGGSWVDDYHECRPTIRQGLNPDVRNSYTGFRCCISDAHKNTFSHNSSFRFHISNAINQRDWITAYQLLNKWSSILKTDPDFEQIQFQIEQGIKAEHNQKILRLLKIRSLQLQVNNAIVNNDWNLATSISQDLLGLNPNDIKAIEALKTIQQHLNKEEYFLFRSRLCYVIDCHRIELEMYKLMTDNDWQNARLYALQLLQRSINKTKFAEILEHIDAELAIRQEAKRQVGKPESKVIDHTGLSKYDAYWKFKAALETENWEAVIEYGQRWLEYSPNSDHVKEAVSKAQNKIQEKYLDQGLNESNIQNCAALQKLTEQAIAENRLGDAKRYATMWYAFSPDDRRASDELARITELLLTPESVNKWGDKKAIAAENNILTQLEASITQSNWDQAIILADKFIKDNRNQTEFLFINAPDTKKKWALYSSKTIALVKNHELLKAVISTSIAIQYAPNKLTIKAILNTIWNKSQKVDKVYCEKTEYENYLNQSKWYEILAIMLAYLVPKSSPKKKKASLPNQTNKNQPIPKLKPDHKESTRNINSSNQIFYQQLAADHRIFTITLPENMSLAFVPVPGGDTHIGGLDSDPQAYSTELPASNIFIPDFWIGEIPITLAQFRAFVKHTGYVTTAEKNNSGFSRFDGKWKEGQGVTWKVPFVNDSPNLKKGLHPVTMVSWYDAIEFCKWLKVLIGLDVQLPSEAEWEKAARGNKMILYPWGNSPPSPEFCNYGNQLYGNTKQAGMYDSKYNSPYGCRDMSGNIWEWTRSIYKDYPYNSSDGRETLSGNERRVIRGGAFISLPIDLRCSARKPMEPEKGSSFLGFRVIIHR